MYKKKHSSPRVAPVHRAGVRGSLKPNTGMARKALAKLEAAAIAAEHALRDRAIAADLREKIADLRDTAAKAKLEAAARLGAQLRDANERLIVTTVRAQEMTELAEQATARLIYMAEHDVLTGLPNRALLTDRVTQAIAMAQRHGNKVALMFLDLDHFKHINDSLGHTVGDQLLQSVAKRLQASIRHSDTVCRQGGDEFVLLLAEVEVKEDIAAFAEKLIESLTEPHLVGSHMLHITMSIGSSVYPDDGSDVEALLRHADTAMYHAKRSGRNRFQPFTPDMNAREVARHSVEESLRQGLEQSEFLLHYQPKVNLATGAITGAEALLRLQPANQRLIFPTEFVSIAEDSALILPIGRWVLREACRQTAKWLQAGFSIKQISVNVSSVEFQNKDFLANLRSILNDTGLDPHCLELELTESGLMHNTEMTMATLQTLKELGVQVAIDDFGTGYSSLSYLRHFPINTLKIDQSFVQDIDAEGSIISAIIAMGKSLKQRIVAEGVETERQLIFLQKHRCAEGQGYYLGRPVDADSFANLLARHRH